jgi:hypothetical protein
LQIIVDGLQGQMLKSLAKGEKRDLFMLDADLLYRQKAEFKPKGVESQPTLEQDINFLKEFTDKGFTHPAYLPFFKKFLAQNKGWAKYGISSTPTISVRNLPLAYSGAGVTGVGSTGIPNFHFVDRKKDRAYYFFGNDALELERLAKNSGMTTMFERLRVFNTINCNSYYDRAHK